MLVALIEDVRARINAEKEAIKRSVTNRCEKVTVYAVAFFFKTL